MVGVTGGSFQWHVGGAGGVGGPGAGATTPSHVNMPAPSGGVVKQTLTARKREAKAGRTRNGPRGPGAVLEKVLGITAKKNVRCSLYLSRNFHYELFCIV